MMASQSTVEPPLEPQLHLLHARVDGDRGYDRSLSWEENGLRIERGTSPSAAATVTADSTTCSDTLLEPQPDSVNSMTVNGDNAAVLRFPQ